jgi:hypothetical protein
MHQPLERPGFPDFDGIENHRNRSSHNATGFPGVRRRGNRFRPSIRVNGSLYQVIQKL